MKKHYSMMWLMAILLTFAVLSVHAQGVEIQGTVTSGADGEGLPGTTVLEKGTTNGTITDLDGKFRLNVAQGAIIVVTSVGYKTVEVSASANMTVSLEEDVTKLSEVVVSGLASSVKRSNLANSVASISSKELTSMSNQSTMDGALYGKFKGANIVSNSGAPGGGISMKLRGLTSINGSNEPLYIIDGIYLDNSSISAGLNVVSAAAGGGSQSNQDNPSNRIADIDPEDIESIEILKGASAAAIYGSRASGGVVIITTKRGSEGKTSVTFSQALGVTQMLNPLGTRQWDAAKVEAAFGAGEVANFQAAQAAGTLRDYENELYGNKGLLSTSRITATGGTERTSYFLGVTRKDDEGIVKNTGYEKTSIRLNLDQKVADWLTLNASTNYINSSADRGFFNNDNSGTTMGVAFVATPSWAQLLPDANGNYPNNPYAASNFLQTRDLITNNETVNRFLVGGKLTARLLQRNNQSLRLTANGGIDQYTLSTTALFPNSLQFQKNGNGLNGVSVQGTTVTQNSNYSFFLVHDYFLSSGLSFTTQAGLTFIDFDQNNIIATATNMNGSQTNLDQSGSVSVAQNRIIQKDRGFFIQEEINFNDMIIGTLGVRGDKSTNNGDVNELYYYPKGALAVNIHKFGFWNTGFLETTKVRAAYGEAGNFAVFGDKFSALNSINIDGSGGLVIANLRGNDAIGPERQSEFETGIDFSFLGGKIAIDATYYIKKVDDLLLRSQVPSSTGQTTAVVNAATMENKGLEIGLTMNLVNKEDLKWSSTTQFWNNRSKVTRLDIPSYTTGGFADFLGQFRIKEGHSPTEIIGVGDNPDEDGLVVFGDAQPDFQMSFLNSVTYKKLEFMMLWHWKQGGENINLSALLSDLSGTSPDFDKIDLDPESNLGNGDYRLSQLGANTGPYIENAGYMRMREVALYYTLPNFFGDAVKSIKIGASGNNLINFFEYRSYDPEVSNFGGQGLSTGVEVTPFPSSKRYNFHIIAKF
ncbi:SusC/RagA family TonB-linked outer membrane protein [Marinoscillum pacificum]|uniref:SusC/RagA family TonB-linked outer membrane protein n=1 Tax=Marinoscillum pacificum TaxID=392723 RepID=UPI0021576DA4|nr:SusC/RagA family TonB-linked outer membrane protein [Marinoscillum pacificum]